MKIENIYVSMPGVDMESVPVEDFVTFIEELTYEGIAYAVLEKPQCTYDFPERPKPIIGYGGKNTFPFISDPDEGIKGAFAIIDRRLIYSSRAIPLHLMRDSYTWQFASTEYYTEEKYIDIIRAFLNAGYPLQHSSDLVDYRSNRRFSTEGSISLEEIYSQR